MNADTSESAEPGSGDLSSLDPAFSCKREKLADPGVLFDQCYGSKRFTGPKQSDGGAGAEFILRRISGEPSPTPCVGTVLGYHQKDAFHVRPAWLQARLHDGRSPVLGLAAGAPPPRPGDPSGDDELDPWPGPTRSSDAGGSDPRGPDRVPGPVAHAECTAQPFERATYVPRSVEACRTGEWSRLLINRRNGCYQFVRFTCGSWRCRRCAPQVNARQAFRIERAIRGFNLEHVVFVTLTFDRTRFKNAGQAWRAARACWKRFRDSLVYELGIGVGRAKAKAKLLYVQVWEQHRSGWPHMHALLISPTLAKRVREQGCYSMPHYKTGEPRAVWRFVRGVLRPIAVSSGFGPVCDLQFVDGRRAAIAGYLVKVARELTEAAGKDQAPLFAPIHFRRLSSTPLLLESLKKVSDFTGAIAPVALELAELALELGGIPLSLKLRELMLYGEAGFVELVEPGKDPPSWPRPKPVLTARSSSIRAGSERTLIEAIATS